MAKGRESFDRRQRERAKKAKADAKRAERLTKGDADGTETETAVPSEPRDDGNVLEALAKLHAAFDDEAISFEDFEEARGELLAKLQVE